MSSTIRQVGYGSHGHSGHTPCMENCIREIRDQKGMTLNQVAQRAGTIASTIEKLEKGRRRLDIGWMRRIAGALGVTPADLLLAEDNPYRPHDKNEAALLSMFRDLSPKAQSNLLSSAFLMLKAERGELTEAEFRPRFPELLEQLREELRNNSSTSRTRTASPEDA